MRYLSNLRQSLNNYFPLIIIILFIVCMITTVFSFSPKTKEELRELDKQRAYERGEDLREFIKGFLAQPR